jgi:hypothetical protein
MSTKEQLIWIGLLVLAALGSVAVCHRSEMFQRRPRVVIESKCPCANCHGACHCQNCKCGGRR